MQRGHSKLPRMMSPQPSSPPSPSAMSRGWGFASWCFCRKKSTKNMGGLTGWFLKWPTNDQDMTVFYIYKWGATEELGLEHLPVQNLVPDDFRCSPRPICCPQKDLCVGNWFIPSMATVPIFLLLIEEILHQWIWICANFVHLKWLAGFLPSKVFWFYLIVDWRPG